MGITGSSIADGYTIRTAILDCIGRLEHDYCSFDGDDVPAKRYQWGARVLLGFSHGGKCAPIRRSIFLQELSLLYSLERIRLEEFIAEAYRGAGRRPAGTSRRSDRSRRQVTPPSPRRATRERTHRRRVGCPSSAVRGGSTGAPPLIRPPRVPCRGRSPGDPPPNAHQPARRSRCQPFRYLETRTAGAFITLNSPGAALPSRRGS